jgi:hypothetical protein
MGSGGLQEKALSVRCSNDDVESMYDSREEQPHL